MQSTILENGMVLPYLRLHTPWGFKDRALVAAILTMLLLLVTGCTGYSGGTPAEYGTTGVVAPMAPSANPGAIYHLNGNLIW